MLENISCRLNGVFFIVVLFFLLFFVVFFYLLLLFLFIFLILLFLLIFLLLLLMLFFSATSMGGREGLFCLLLDV